MGNVVTTKQKIKEITVEATIYRADGTVEYLGVIANSKFGLLKRLGNRIMNTIKGVK